MDIYLSKVICVSLWCFSGLQKVVLSIAGSDSGGGAGIQADLRTFFTRGVFGVSAITAITAQNTQTVSLVHPLPAHVVAAQLDALYADFTIAAVKIGMLANLAVVRVVSDFVQQISCPVILDPVLKSTSGAILLENEAIEYLEQHILPYVTVFTPNIPEASIFSGIEITAQTSLAAVYRRLLQKAPQMAILLKGGHLPLDYQGIKVTVDRFWENDAEKVFVNPYICSENLHGTGCTLASVIAAEVAKGVPTLLAVETAISYVHKAILAATKIGGGNSPIKQGFFQDE
ncbi:MAG: bifunctional hydroxymethylpyrimidine kinase/phosphomethylpyrimidine kinase [Bacteroidia bacterium]|nr:bifunctional hydroxymethylpyrimidine kinase/phosphomethylpyrimidine kinase [Bacteroidia bacterium]